MPTGSPYGGVMMRRRGRCERGEDVLHYPKTPWAHGGPLLSQREGEDA